MRIVLVLTLLYAGITGANGCMLASSAEQSLLSRQAAIDRATD